MAELTGLERKTLSRAGKEILLKFVAQEIPSYVMSCFRLPSRVCHQIESSMSNFWWGQKQDERKLHWISWKKLCQPKGAGGLGFRDLELFNQALLAKQGWRLLTSQDSLLFKVWKAWYFPRKSLLEADLGYRPSYTWRSVWGALESVKEGLRWRIGDGKSVKIWEDAWVSGFGNGKILSAPHPGVDICMVEDLINPQTR